MARHKIELFFNFIDKSRFTMEALKKENKQVKLERDVMTGCYLELVDKLRELEEHHNSLLELIEGCDTDWQLEMLKDMAKDRIAITQDLETEAAAKARRKKS